MYEDRKYIYIFIEYSWIKTIFNTKFPRQGKAPGGQQWEIEHNLPSYSNMLLYQDPPPPPPNKSISILLVFLTRVGHFK